MLRIPSLDHPQPGPAAPVRATRGVARTGWRWLQRAVLALALALLLIIGILPALGLYRTATVLSGSMRPTFSPGDVVMLVPEPLSAVRVGQVISYRVPVGEHQIETHRVVRIIKGGAAPTVQTRGDANNTNDPWTATLEGNTAWREVGVIPKLGFLVNAMRSATLHTAAVLIAPLLLALLLLWEIWGSGRRRGRDRRAAAAPAAAAEGA